LAIRSLTPFVKARHFHWSQQRLAFVKTPIYTLDFTRPEGAFRVSMGQFGLSLDPYRAREYHVTALQHEGDRHDSG
jgi:hypothetical protein